MLTLGLCLLCAATGASLGCIGVGIEMMMNENED